MEGFTLPAEVAESFSHLNPHPNWRSILIIKSSETIPQVLL